MLFKTLEELRQWHYNQALLLKAATERHIASKRFSLAMQCDKLFKTNMSAVYQLNSVCKGDVE